MYKPVLFAMLAAVGAIVFVSEAEARCCRRNCCAAQSCGCSAAPACGSACGIAPAAIDPAITANSTAPAANSSSSYQSYSYEPGTSPAAVAVVPVQTYRRNYQWSEYNNVLRGSKKVMNPNF